MRRLLLAVVVAIGMLAPVVPAGAADVSPYRGLGAWVDVFDYAPRLQHNGDPPAVTADSVADMAALGVRTLYLQIGRDDANPSTTLIDVKEVRAFVAAAHRVGIAVVAWYLPSLDNVDADLRPVQGIHRLRVDGRGFDGIGLDMESNTVANPTDRNNRLVDFTKRVRSMVGDDTALAAIVYATVQLEVINPYLWPGFPYRRLEPSIDVWMPMSYYTFRSQESGYRDAFAYTQESVERLRKHLRHHDAAVHAIGGIADLTNAKDYEAFLRAVHDTKAIGYSVYDYGTTSSAAWTYLRKGGGSNRSG
ncbi:MAG TPA: hypothetical protein VGA11_01840 [Acidimicrobiia bacterium]